MNKLLDAVYELVIDQHPNKINALASSIKSCSLEDASTLKNFFATEAANKSLIFVLREWSRLGCTSDELAGILKGASHGYLSEKAREQVQLVWTGPDFNQVPIRHSEQILLELINSAHTSLYIISFVLVKVPAVEEAIVRALARDVDVRMLLESEDKDGAGNFQDTIKRLQTEIPELILYIWPRENRETIAGGFARVHAKCVVADQKTAFITSANLTAAALDKNIEMGVHVKGGKIPLTIYQQFLGMIRAREITPYVGDRYSNATTAANKPSATQLTQLSDNLEAGTEKLISFKNSILDVEEQRYFKALGADDDMPKQNSIVLIRFQEQWFIGKYVWSRLQETEVNRVYYLVTLRGFGPKTKIEIEEADWESFFPKAVAVTK
ncbi:DISARM system phospholipase D-like protein DrmC [Leucothrix arctica]|uniref:Phospholipase n=1 Tax=Leucothrix arctica TaxID=1481894 RepID=A0A317C5F1_9GAMM|nr:DISARM system phospholipase D-like protein DrmC [Leucothrix arctica]PWQ93499.1 phospholipase [Leucothrix arctica]